MSENDLEKNGGEEFVAPETGQEKEHLPSFAEFASSKGIVAQDYREINQWDPVIDREGSIFHKLDHIRITSKNLKLQTGLKRGYFPAEDTRLFPRGIETALIRDYFRSIDSRAEIVSKTPSNPMGLGKWPDEPSGIFNVAAKVRSVDGNEGYLAAVVRPTHGEIGGMPHGFQGSELIICSADPYSWDQVQAYLERNYHEGYLYEMKKKGEDPVSFENWKQELQQKEAEVDKKIFDEFETLKEK